MLILEFNILNGCFNSILILGYIFLKLEVKKKTCLSFKMLFSKLISSLILNLEHQIKSKNRFYRDNYAIRETIFFYFKLLLQNFVDCRYDSKFLSQSIRVYKMEKYLHQSWIFSKQKYFRSKR